MLQSDFAIVITLLFVFLAAIAGGFVAMRLRLPLIVGYITTGMLIGNFLPQFINRQFLTTVSDVGVTLLLFALGVEFSLQRFRQVLRIVGWASLVQIVLVFLVVHMVLLFFGIAFLASIFIAIAASLSSTAVVIKLLSEEGEQSTGYGEASIAWSVVQDLAVVPIMLLLPAIVGATGNQNETYASILTTIGANLAKASLILLLIIYSGRYVLPWVLRKVVRLASRELFVITIVSVVLVSAATTVALGLSAAIGAFLAGLLVAETSQNHAIFSEIRPLRDIFSVIFFVSLGLLVSPGTVIPLLPVIAAVACLVVLLKGGIIYALSRFMGFHKKAAFYIMLALIPMSEFGFIVATEGKKLGALNGDTYTFTVLVSFVTILFGSPLFGRRNRLYAFVNTVFFSKIPAMLPQKNPLLEKPPEVQFENHVIICGFGRVGKYIGRALEMSRVPFVIVDYNHETLMRARDRGLPVVNGDPGDREILEHAQLGKARTIIIAIPDLHTQELVIGNARSINKNIHIICRCHHEEDQKYLKALGVDAIIQPEFEAALTIAAKLLSNYGLPSDEIQGKISRLKIEHGLG